MVTYEVFRHSQGAHAATPNHIGGVSPCGDTGHDGHGPGGR